MNWGKTVYIFTVCFGVSLIWIIIPDDDVGYILSTLVGCGGIYLLANIDTGRSGGVGEFILNVCVGLIGLFGVPFILGAL